MRKLLLILILVSTGCSHKLVDRERTITTSEEEEVASFDSSAVSDRNTATDSTYTRTTNREIRFEWSGDSVKKYALVYLETIVEKGQLKKEESEKSSTSTSSDSNKKSSQSEQKDILKKTVKPAPLALSWLFWIVVVILVSGAFIVKWGPLLKFLFRVRV